MLTISWSWSTTRSSSSKSAVWSKPVTTGVPLPGTCLQVKPAPFHILHRSIETKHLCKLYIEITAVLACKVNQVIEVNILNVELIWDCAAGGIALGLHCRGITLGLRCLGIALGLRCRLLLWDCAARILLWGCAAGYCFGTALPGYCFGTALPVIALGLRCRGIALGLRCLGIALGPRWGGHWFGTELPRAECLVYFFKLISQPRKKRLKNNFAFITGSGFFIFF